MTNFKQSGKWLALKVQETRSAMACQISMMKGFLRH